MACPVRIQEGQLKNKWSSHFSSNCNTGQLFLRQGEPAIGDPSPVGMSGKVGGVKMEDGTSENRSIFPPNRPRNSFYMPSSAALVPDVGGACARRDFSLLSARWAKS